MTRRIALKDALVFSEVGRVRKVHAFRLDRGGESIRVGASASDVTGLLGTPAHRFERDGETFWQFPFGKRRFEAVVDGGKLRRVEISIEPLRLPSKLPPHGVGSKGDMRSEVRLALDDIKLGTRAADIDAMFSATTERLSRNVRRYGPKTFVGFDDDDKAIWVLGSTISKDGEPWVRAGSPAATIQNALATVGQLRHRNAYAVSYTFRQYGDVRMRLEPDGNVSLLELTARVK